MAAKKTKISNAKKAPGASENKKAPGKAAAKNTRSPRKKIADEKKKQSRPPSRAKGAAVPNPAGSNSFEAKQLAHLSTQEQVGPVFAPGRRPSRGKSFLADLRDALRGTEADYTQGSISRAIVLLSVPMMLELVLESVFAIVDVFFVSSLGKSAVATIGLTESIMTLVYALGIGLSLGTTALVARRIGEKNQNGAADAAVQAIFVAIVVSIPFSLAGIFFSAEILDLMGADEWSLKHGRGYMAWMLGGNAAIMLLFVINAIFRGAGDAAIAMRILWLSNGINIILDPILIFGWGPAPALGIQGAAIASNIGRTTGVLIQLWVLFQGAKHIRIAKEQWKIRTTVLISLVKTSLGGIGQFIIATSAYIGLMRIASEFGSSAVAGFTIAVRIFIFTFLPAWGMSNAAATLVGQNLGAGKPERAEKSVWITGFATMTYMLLVSFIYVFFNEPLVRIFSSEPEVLAAGTACLFIASFGYIFYAWGLVMPQAFNGAGDTITPTWINFFCFWLLQIPLAFILALHSPLGLKGIFWSMLISESLAGVAGIILFRRGSWKLVQV